MNEHVASFRDLKKFMDAQSSHKPPSDLGKSLRLVPIVTSLSDLKPSQSIPQSWFFDKDFLDGFKKLFVTGGREMFVFDTKPAVRVCREGNDKTGTLRNSAPELVTFDTMSNAYSASRANQSFKSPGWTTFLVRLNG